MSDLSNRVEPAGDEEGSIYTPLEETLANSGRQTSPETPAGTALSTNTAVSKPINPSPGRNVPAAASAAAAAAVVTLNTTTDASSSGAENQRPTRRTSFLPVEHVVEVPVPMERMGTRPQVLKPSSDGEASGNSARDGHIDPAVEKKVRHAFSDHVNHAARPHFADALPRHSTEDYDLFNADDGTGYAGDDHDDVGSVDSYGIPKYQQRYPPESGRLGNPGTLRPDAFDTAVDDLSVPWRLRNPQHSRFQCTFFDFLREPQFWQLFLYATRITAIAVLVPSAIIAANLKGNPFVSPFMVISSTVLAAKANVGEAIAYLFVWIRAGCLWLPIAVIGGALDLGNHIAGWCVYYTAMLVIMAVFTEAMPRRICLLLFNSCMVGLLTNTTRRAEFACRVMGDWSIGTGLCLVAAFVPFPIFCKKEAQKHLSYIAKNTGTAFRGLVYSFWSPSNVERNMAMSKVRIMTDSLDGLLPAFEHMQAFSTYEFLFESAEVRELRTMKFHLFERLRVNLSSMMRVLDMVEVTPHAIDSSDRSQAFGQVLTPHLNNVAESFDELMDLLAAAKTKKDILALSHHFENMRLRTDELQEAYLLARRMLFYEHTSDTLEEFVPLMTFYLFTVICFRDTMEIFEMQVSRFDAGVMNTVREIFQKTAKGPFMENVHYVKKLLSDRNRREVQRLIEAIKVSAAMILTIGFSYLIKVDKASFSGPNIIAFVSGMNPVEAVQASIVRLTGCLIGTVLGFFAGTYSTTPVQRVASLCTLMFIGTFLRTDKEYGIMSVYAMFVLIPLDSIIETTIEDTVSRMNQNTFGIFIYLFVSILILPLSPSQILRQKRRNVLKRMSSVVSNMMWLFSIPLVSDFGSKQYSFTNMKDFGRVEYINFGRGPFLEMETQQGGTEGQPNQLSNRSMHMVKGADTPMEELLVQLDDVNKRLKSTKEFMGFAKDERGLVTIDYPVKACMATYHHMYRMTVLLKTMWLSWNVIRSQSLYTPETRHMMRNLQPVARDVAGAFSRIVELITYMMKDPSVNLEGDLTKTELELLAACTELHTRKSQIMLMLINTSVQEFRDRGIGGDSKDTDPEEYGFPSTTNPLDGEGSKNGRKETSVFASRSATDAPRPRDGSGTSLQHHGSSANDGGFDIPRSPVSRRPLSRAATFDGQSLAHGSQQSPYMSPNSRRPGQYGNFRVVASERNVSVLPYLNRPVKTPTEVSEGPVRLPADFRFPVTSEDAEGMHSFTLCLEMFAEETKLLMMSLGVMTDHMRSKL